MRDLGELGGSMPAYRPANPDSGCLDRRRGPSVGRLITTDFRDYAALDDLDVVAIRR